MIETKPVSALRRAKASVALLPAIAPSAVCEKPCGDKKETSISGGWDIVLIARAPLVKAEWRKVVDALNSLMQRSQMADSK